jgi:type IV pilus assembly protein PilV
MKHSRFQGGVTLVETLVAVLILAFGVLGMVGLQAKSTVAISEARSRAEAVMSSEKLIALIWNDQGNAANYSSASSIANQTRTNWLTELQTKIPGASAKVTVATTTPVAGTTRNQVDITICWKDHGDPAPASAGFACDAAAYMKSYSNHRVIAFLEPAR